MALVDMAFAGALSGGRSAPPLDKRALPPKGREPTLALLFSLGLLTAVGTAFILVANPAGASTSWTITPSPNQGVNKSNSLGGVSCTDATHCMAVGSYYMNGATQQTLAETWNGSSWTITPTPNQGVNESNSLRGVSCTNSTHCVAVGAYQPQ